jgi:hypothetical protein
VLKSHRFTTSEDLETEMVNNKVWETIRENIKISVKEGLYYCELKKYKIWFEKGYSVLLD